MALKALLDKIDDLPEDVKKEYKKGDDGKFHLDVEGIDSHPGVAVLKRSMERAKEERGVAQTEARELREKLTKANDDLDDMRRGAIPKADVDALEASYKRKQGETEAQYKARVEKLESVVDKNMRQAQAASLASELFVSPTLGLPHILPRLKVVEEGDEFVVKVLDLDGKPSASTLDDLKKEIVQNKEFAPILRGTRASGGGASGGQGGGGAPSDDTNFDAAKASPKDLAARIKARKEAEGG